MAESKLLETFEDLDLCEVNTCKSVKRLKQILHFMHFLEDNNDDNQDIAGSLVEYTQKNQYFNIMNDYHHIITKHLNTNDLAKNDENYQIINKAVTQLINCDIETCTLYRRNGRDREKATKDKDNKGCILLDILDNIHTHFIHSYDTGYRLKPSAYEQPNPQQDDNDDDDFDPNALCVDATLKSLKRILGEKRKRLESIRGKDRVQNNKFMTDFNKQQQNDIKESSDDDTKEDKEAYANTASDFSFGTKLYYWSYYKNNSDEDRIFHPGDVFSNWYIEATYSSFKEEILSAVTSRNIFTDTLEKAEYILANSQTIKRMKCRNGLYDTELSTRYNVTVDTPLSCAHLMSVIFYTDFSKLSYEFSSSFRKNSAKESVEALKKRNAKFWHWAKLLNETVSLFGNRLNYRAEPRISTLYHGVSFMYFDSFVTRFISPTSTTLSMSVATMFAEDGIILAIEHKGGMEEMFPYYFNCSLVSCFANENERLFIGGNGDAEYYREGLLEFKSIWLMNEQQNLQPFIRALSLFSIVINGQGHIDKEKYAKPVKWYYKIICLLIKDIKSPNAAKCPPYIRTCFKKLLDSRKYVKVNLFGMFKYSEFSQMLMSSEIANLVEVEYISKLFQNCTKIVCYMNYSPVSKYFIRYLVGVLNKMDSDKSIKLREIVFEAYVFYPKFGLKQCQSVFAKELNGKWMVNHLELFTGVGCWNGDCNGLQIIYNEHHQSDNNEPVSKLSENTNENDGNDDTFALAPPPKARNKQKKKKSDECLVDSKNSNT